MSGLPYRHLVYSSARELDSLYADLGNPSVVLQSCISLHFLTAVVTSLSSDFSANTFAVFFLNFNYPLAPTHKENKRSSLSAFLPSVLSPPVSACLWLLSSVFRWLFLIICPKFIIVICQSIGEIWTTPSLAEGEFFFVCCKCESFETWGGLCYIGIKTKAVHQSY